jgi:thioredoxin reductase (NADPH)
MVSEEVSDLKVSGLFFAIRQEPATKFLDGQLELHSDGYVVTKPGTTQTSVRGVFATRDVQDKKYTQVVTTVGTGSSTSSISPLHYLNFTLCDHVLFHSVILYLHDETCSLGSRVTNKLIYS